MEKDIRELKELLKQYDEGNSNYAVLKDKILILMARIIVNESDKKC